MPFVWPAWSQGEACHAGRARRRRRRAPGRYLVCATVGCDIAWFSEAGHRLLVSASRVAIGQKSTAPDRTLCYCFGHTARDVSAAVVASITEGCRRGEDRCPETNPQGSCCLGNVHAALKGAMGRSCDC